MKTHLKTIHNEKYSDDGREVGILFNYSDEDKNWKDSLIYIYHSGRYIFFITIFDMFNYQLNGSYGVKCAYMSEDDFDKYFDAEFIEGAFADNLKWI